MVLLYFDMNKEKKNWNKVATTRESEKWAEQKKSRTQRTYMRAMTTRKATFKWAHTHVLCMCTSIESLSIRRAKNASHRKTWTKGMAKSDEKKDAKLIFYFCRWCVHLLLFSSVDISITFCGFNNALFCNFQSNGETVKRADRQRMASDVCISAAIENEKTTALKARYLICISHQEYAKDNGGTLAMLICSARRCGLARPLVHFAFVAKVLTFLLVCLLF